MFFKLLLYYMEIFREVLLLSSLYEKNLIFFLFIFSTLALAILIVPVPTVLLSILKTNVKKTRQCLLPPGPKPYPIIGCLLQAYKNRPTSQWVHKIMDEMETEIACIRLGSIHVIPVTSPELGREFLKNKDAIFASRPTNNSTFLPSSGYRTTVFAPYGDHWKKMKRIVTTTILSPNTHELLHNSRVEEADHIVTYILNKCKNASRSSIVDVRMVARHYCANVMRKMLFGKRFFGEGMPDGGPGEQEMEHVDAVFAVLERVFAFDVADYMPSLSYLDISGHSKILKKGVESARKYQDKEIDERIRKWEDGSRVEPEDVLDSLILLKDDEDGRPLLCPEDIKAQCLELMMASMDNPSNAFEWALFEMLNQPSILSKAIEELDNVVGRGRLVQEFDLPNLNYIIACAKETFRLHPIASFVPPHVSTEDTIINDYFIPKGSHVLLSRLGLGRNPRVWKDPLKFDPERHLVACNGSIDSLNEPDLCMISFSTGRRGCPAVKLGSTMTCMLFARLLQAFHWCPPEDEVGVDLTESNTGLRLAKPLLAQAKPRLAYEVYSSMS